MAATPQDGVPVSQNLLELLPDLFVGDARMRRPARARIRLKWGRPTKMLPDIPKLCYIPTSLLGPFVKRGRIGQAICLVFYRK